MVNGSNTAALKPSTTYHYRIVASNVTGTTAASDDQTTVLVTVVTDSPDDESRNAVLRLAGEAIKTLRFPTDGAT